MTKAKKLSSSLTLTVIFNIKVSAEEVVSFNSLNFFLKDILIKIA